MTTHSSRSRSSRSGNVCRTALPGHALILAICWLASAGCSRPDPGPPLKAPTGVTAKVGSGTIIFYRMDDAPLFMICADFSAGTQSASAGAGGPPWVSRAAGNIASQSGHQIVWSFKKQGKQTPEFIINGQHFELERGRLFVATAEGTQVAVKQEPVEMSAVKSDPEGLREFAAGFPELHDLLKLPTE